MQIHNVEEINSGVDMESMRILRTASTRQMPVQQYTLEDPLNKKRGVS